MDALTKPSNEIAKAQAELAQAIVLAVGLATDAGELTVQAPNLQALAALALRSGSATIAAAGGALTP